MSSQSIIQINFKHRLWQSWGKPGKHSTLSDVCRVQPCPWCVSQSWWLLTKISRSTIQNNLKLHSRLSWGQPGKQAILSDTFHVQLGQSRSRTFTALKIIVVATRVGGNPESQWCFQTHVMSDLVLDEPNRWIFYIQINHNQFSMCSLVV